MPCLKILPAESFKHRFQTAVVIGVVVGEVKCKDYRHTRFSVAQLTLQITGGKKQSEKAGGAFAVQVLPC